MRKEKRSLLYVLPLVLIISFWIFSCSSTIEPSQSPQEITLTVGPTATTASQLFAEPSPTPTETQAPTVTVLRPTPTAEPFLPSDISLIGTGSIGDLQKIATIPVREIYMLAFSQSGNKLAALSEHWQDRSDYLEVWDLVKGERILSLENLDSPWNPYFSPDESQLFVSYAEQGIEIYDLIKQKLVRSLEISADWHAYSPDGKYLALGEYLGTTDESTISVVDQATVQELFAATVPGMVMKVEFSPDSDLLIGGFQGPNHFRDLVWKIATQELVADLIDYDYGPIFSPDNSLVATSKEGKVYIFSTEGWVLRSSYGFADPYSDVKPKDFSQGGDILAAEDRNNIVFLETMSGEELYVLPGECDTLFSPKGTTLITWCYQGEIIIWGVMP